MPPSEPRLVGREQELAEVDALVQKRVPWITLVGLPGAGKSALAAELGRRHDIIVIDPPGQAREQKRDGDRTVVATAWSPLRTQDEHVVRIALLPMPSNHAEAADVLASPSVKLFLAAASRAGTSVRDPGAAAPALAEIARAASGFPLALRAAAELAALHPVEQLAGVLARPSSIPVVVDAGAGTLGEAFVSFWGSLSSDAAKLLARVAPHRSGYRVPALTAHTDAALRELALLGAVVRVDASPDELTFRAPLLVARLFLEHVSPDVAREAQRAHALETAARVNREVERMLLSGARAAREALDGAQADLDDALAFALESGDPDACDEVASAALGRARATGADPTTTTPRILALARAGKLGPRSLARLAIERATLAERAGRVDEALAALTEAAMLAAPFDAARGEVALALGVHQMHFRRDYDAARRAFEEAIGSPDLATSARARISLGGTYAENESFGEAIRVLEAAREVLRGVDAPRFDAMAVTNLLLSRTGYWVSPVSIPPRTVFVEDGLAAAATFDAIGDERGAAFVRLDTGLALMALLRFEEAQALLERATPALEALGHPGFVFAACDLGCVLAALGSGAAARDQCARGQAFADRNGQRLLSGVARAELADVAWELGDLRGAREAITEARALLEGCDDAARLGLVLVEEAVLRPGADARAIVDRARSLVADPDHVYAHAIGIYGALLARRRGEPDADAEAAALPWLEAVARLMGTPPEHRGADGRGAPWAVWLALRRLVGELDPITRREWLERAHGLSGSIRGTLLVDVDTRSVRAPDGSWIDLSRRENSFALLRALAGPPWARARPVHTVADLTERVWPGEKVLASAAANRVYVAMATLRKLGALRDMILSDEGGYRLAAGLDVRVFGARYTRAE